MIPTCWKIKNVRYKKKIVAFTIAKIAPVLVTHQLRNSLTSHALCQRILKA